MRLGFGEFKFTVSIAALIAANLVPLFGVVYLGWDVGTILLLYWLENLVIGLLNIPKMWACEGAVGQKLFLTPFFAFHFGLFCFGHGAFLSSMFDQDFSPYVLLAGGAVTWTALSFLISHNVSMIFNFYGKKEYQDRTTSQQMFLPYGRIIVMHLVVLIGGALAEAFGAPIAALFVLIALKTFMDLTAHRLEHGDIIIEAQAD